jgi:hypothetical protein
MSSAPDHFTAYPLDLRFKGERNYVQGPDVLTSILDALDVRCPGSRVSDIDIVFHCLARSGLTLVADPPADVQPAVQFSCRIAGERRKFGLIEDGRAIASRQPYREEEIVAATEISPEERSASSSAVLPYTDIERWVAMVKALHLAVYPGLAGKWLFVRGKFAGCARQSAAATHRVVIEANFNNKLTRSAVLVDSRRIGDIFFSLD